MSLDDRKLWTTDPFPFGNRPFAKKTGTSATVRGEVPPTPHAQPAPQLSGRRTSPPSFGLIASDPTTVIVD